MRNERCIVCGDGPAVGIEEMLAKLMPNAAKGVQVMAKTRIRSLEALGRVIALGVALDIEEVNRP